jgi:predicted enzyme related to lactoylglutathione lyase
MTSGIQAVVYPIHDIGTAKQLVTTLLGVEPNMDEPFYVNFSVDGQDVGLDPNGHSKGMTGPVSYWQVENIAECVDALVAAGAATQQTINDVGGGKLIATVTDADGNVIGLTQPPAGGWS